MMAQGVMEAVRQHGEALQAGSAELQADRELAMAAAGLSIAKVRK